MFNQNNNRNQQNNQNNHEIIDKRNAKIKRRQKETDKRADILQY